MKKRKKKQYIKLFMVHNQLIIELNPLLNGNYAELYMCL